MSTEPEMDQTASVEAANPIDPDDDNLCDDGLDYGGEHCGNDCGAEDPEECVHCGCCTCTSCEYARVG